MNKNDGNDNKKPSLILILTPNPMSINNDNPADEIIKMSGNFKPINNPTPPSNCKQPVNTLNLSKPYRSNSACIVLVVIAATP